MFAPVVFEICVMCLCVCVRGFEVGQLSQALC